MFGIKGDSGHSTDVPSGRHGDRAGVDPGVAARFPLTGVAGADRGLLGSVDMSSSSDEIVTVSGGENKDQKIHYSVYYWLSRNKNQ